MKYLLLFLFHDSCLEIDRRVLWVPFAGAEPRSVRLLQRNDGHLVTQDMVPSGEELSAPEAGQTLIGLLHFSRAGDGCCCFLRTHPGVVLDGRAPPLSLTALDAGSTLTLGDQTWVVAHAWKPVPCAAPAACGDQLCPVCSAPLSLGPIVECYCGKLVHLQAARADEVAANQLNCFLQSGRCTCGMEPSFLPQLLPVRWRNALDLQLSSAPQPGDAADE